MSNSLRAQARRRKRSKLSKHGRGILSSQHFGDGFVYRGRPLRRGQNKQALMEAGKTGER